MPSASDSTVLLTLTTDWRVASSLAQTVSDNLYQLNGDDLSGKVKLNQVPARTQRLQHLLERKLFTKLLLYPDQN